MPARETLQLLLLVPAVHRGPKYPVDAGRFGDTGRNYISPTVGCRDRGGRAISEATTKRQGHDMKRLAKGYRYASGCVALAISMSMSTAAHAEEHGKLRVPGTLPAPLLSDISTTDYAEVKAKQGARGAGEQCWG